MSARIIDGKTIAADLRGRIADAVHRLRRDRGIVPGIAVVTVGDNPASEVYVRTKSKAVAEAGMKAFDHKLPVSARRTGADGALVSELDANEEVSGILVQLPLPKRSNEESFIAAMNPSKDVDGFHPFNAGRLASGLPVLVPCTPMGCVLLAKSVHKSLAGLAGRGDRTIQHRRQAGRAVAARRKRDGDGRAFEDE